MGEHHPHATPAEAQALAERAAQCMWSNDRASRELGMRIDAVGPGTARLSMTVRADMLNGHDICHGGFVFTLADSAFAYACNSYNLVTVASGAGIDFLAPARAGDVLSALAVERSASGRTGVYDIEVTNQRGERIALFRGKSYRIKGHIVESAPVEPGAIPAKAWTQPTPESEGVVPAKAESQPTPDSPGVVPAKAGSQRL